MKKRKTKPTTKPKAFTRLTAAQKRVAIAKDVLKQIKAKRLLIETGSYLSWDALKLRDERTPFSKATLTKPNKCHACAVGSAVASGLRLFNDGALSVYVERDDAFSTLRRWFSRNQVIAIEVAFEHESTRALEQRYRGDKFLNRAAAEFQFRRSDIGKATQRAVAIFKNIIANNGEFKP